MNNSFASTKLGDICKFQGGSAFKQELQGEKIGHIPFIKVSDMNRADNEIFILGAANWISEEIRQQIRAKLHKADSTVFAKIGVALTFNRRRMLTRPTLIDNNMLSANAINENSDRFLYFLLSNIDFNVYSKGSALPYLNISDLAEIEVLLPPVREQKAIASVLGVLDDKIENNRRMNETLEEMARAIFKSWFVDFDPVHAKAAGNPPAYMDNETAALFPSTFGDDGLPKGWKKGLIDSIANLNKTTLKPADFATSYIEHYSLPAYDEGRYPAIDFGEDVKSNKTIVPKNSVLLTKLNPNIERVWLPIFASDYAAVSSTEFLVLTAKGVFERDYLYSLFRSRSFLARYEGLVTGTSKSHQRVRPQMLLDMEVTIPSENLVRAFNLVVENNFKKIIANQKENQTLAELRDIILPKLMSGEICVKDAAKQ